MCMCITCARCFPASGNTSTTPTESRLPPNLPPPSRAIRARTVAWAFAMSFGFCLPWAASTTWPAPWSAARRRWWAAGWRACTPSRTPTAAPRWARTRRIRAACWPIWPRIPTRAACCCWGWAAKTAASTRSGRIWANMTPTACVFWYASRWRTRSRRRCGCWRSWLRTCAARRACPVRPASWWWGSSAAARTGSAASRPIRSSASIRPNAPVARRW